MNSPWIKSIFILSLVLNCMVAGAVTYKYIFSRPYTAQQDVLPQQGIEHGRGHLLSEDARRELKGQIRNERARIQEAQDRLMDILKQENPDRDKINAELASITTTQSGVQNMVMDKVLKELQTLPPDQRAEYLSKLRDAMCFRGMFGMGRGMGGRGDGCRKNRFMEQDPQVFPEKSVK